MINQQTKDIYIYIFIWDTLTHVVSNSRDVPEGRPQDWENRLQEPTFVIILKVYLGKPLEVLKQILVLDHKISFIITPWKIGQKHRFYNTFISVSLTVHRTPQIPRVVGLCVRLACHVLLSLICIQWSNTKLNIGFFLQTSWS